jgi:glutamate synthase domain-containing protein 3
VDLEEVTDPADLEAVRNLIVKHVEATGSPRGQWILENWLQLAPKFVKVFPHEYKRVLGVSRSPQSVSVQLTARLVPRQPTVAHG